MPISDNWPDVEASLEQLEEPTAKRITSLHDHLLPYSTRISAYASSLHPKRLPCRLITSSYTWGQSFLVYELVFEDPDHGGEDDDRRNESWVARFGLPPYEGDEFFNTPEQLERKILNEVGALKVVRERTTVPVPTIFGYCARHGDGFNQKFGGVIDDDGVRRKPHPLGEAFPAFILMSALRGKTIEECGIPIHELGGHWDVPPAEDDAPYFTSSILQNYLKSLASIHMQLSQVTFPQVGSFTVDDETGEVKIGPMAEFGLGPFDTAEEYYATLAEAFKRMAEAAQEEDEELDDEDEGSDASETVLTIERGDEHPEKTVTLSGAQVRSLRRMFTAAIFPLALGPYVPSSNDRGPFPLRHGDMHSENILVDEETGNIIGVIDWEGAGTVPWEVAGGLNWEVQGNATPKLEAEKGSDVLERPEIHSAFRRALKKVEAEMSKWFRPGAKKQPPAELKLEQKSRPLSPISPSPDSLSPSASAISLSSSTSSLGSDLDSMKSHSRSSSSSKTNLTSPPTSPASSMFELSKKEKEKEDSSSLVWTGPRRMPSIAILNTPPSPQKPTAPKEPKTDLMSLAKKFFRAASEPAGNPTSLEGTTDNEETPQPTAQHSRSVSLSPVIIETIREPLPADYLKQMVNKSEISLAMATMSITTTPGTPTSTSATFGFHPPPPGAKDANGNRLSLTPKSSVFRSPPGQGSPSTARSPRGTLHKRRQSSMALPPLGLATPGGSPGHSPVIPSLNLYGPQPFAPPPLLAASLSLPAPSKRHGTPSPSGTPNEHMSRCPSPLATPHASTLNHPHSTGHAPTSFTFSLPRTPTGHGHGHARARTSWHEHEFGGGHGHGHGGHVRTPSASYFSPNSLARSASMRDRDSQKTTPSTSPFAHPAKTSTPPVVLSSPAPSSASRPPVPPKPIATTKPTPLKPEPPVKSPAGATLSELHGSVGAYVASYLAHWMFVFGCEYETVGKALWDIVLCSRVEQLVDAEGEDGKKAVGVDEAFWVWVKQTLGNSGEEEEEGEGEGTETTDRSKDEPLLSTSGTQVVTTSKTLDNHHLPEFTLERVAQTPSGTLRGLTNDLVADKAIDKVD